MCSSLVALILLTIFFYCASTSTGSTFITESTTLQSATIPSEMDYTCGRLSTTQSSFENKEPDGPWIPCSFLPDEFIECKEANVMSKDGNSTNEVDICTRLGGSKYQDVQFINVSCSPLPCVECSGPRTFSREVPCVKYTGHFFLSSLLYSVFLGLLAVDRFCLGYSAIAVGKLMTAGGLGFWWVIDIILLITGNLTPADDSNWDTNY